MIGYSALTRYSTSPDQIAQVTLTLITLRQSCYISCKSSAPTSSDNPAHSAYTGSWLEFGVWEGATLNGVADYRKVNCDANAPPVFGFDTFTGLPEDWGSFRPTVSWPPCICKLSRDRVHKWLQKRTVLIEQGGLQVV